MKRTNGFTLIQTIMVLIVIALILGIFATFAVPPQSALLAETFSASLLQDMRFTQILSMSQNQRYRLVTSASSYQIQNASGTAIVNPATNTTSISYPTGVTVSPATTTIFDSIGHPYDASNVALSSSRVFTVSAATASKTFTVTAQTGLIQ